MYVLYWYLDDPFGKRLVLGRLHRGVINFGGSKSARDTLLQYRRMELESKSTEITNRP